MNDPWDKIGDREESYSDIDSDWLDVKSALLFLAIAGAVLAIISYYL